MGGSGATAFVVRERRECDGEIIKMQGGKGKRGRLRVWVALGFS